MAEIFLCVDSTGGESVEFEKSSHVRFAILIFSLLLSTAIYCDQQALSFTIISMRDVVESQTSNATEDHWLENPAQKNALFSIVAVGQLIGTIPIVPILHAIGMRYTFVFYGVVATCGTLMLPLAVEFGYASVMVTRFMQVCIVGTITSHWSALLESGTYIAILSCSAQVSPVLTLPLASAFCESSLGWSYVYYLFGITSVIVVIAFFTLYRDDPKNHWMVNPAEQSAVSLGKEGQSIKEPVPYKDICQDRCMQAVLLTTFGGNTAFFIFLHYGPTFINKALGLDITETGFATALPYALCLMLKFVAGPLFDHSTFISERNRVVMFASLSQGVMAVCFFVLSQFATAPTQPIHVPGVARQHVHFVMVCVTIGGCVISFILPFVVALFCPNNSMHEVSRVGLIFLINYFYL
ncbi:unnamed protein product [Haemonchus placei]|uniref:MFS domain-containing protein n=1 Tax=Haemonchus placei TaxID=6290 RepID=A0A0N4VSL5_HAEPC|nr:unnamed protein product [Haemonchus placei]